MATVADVIENVYDMVTGGRRAVVVLKLRAGLNTTDDAALFTGDVTNVNVNDILEINDEQMLIVHVSQATRSVAVLRGYGRTTPEEHAVGAFAYVQPVLRQRQVREAISREIRSLPPKLFGTESYDLTTDNRGWYELEGISDSSRVVCIASVMIGPGTDDAGIWTNAQFAFHRNLTDEGEGRAGVKILGASAGKEVRVTVGVRFDTSNLANDTVLSDIGLQDSWQDILELGAAAQVSTALEAQRMLTDRLSVGPDAEKVQSGTRAAVASMYTKQRNRRLSEEHMALRARYPYVCEVG